MAYNHVTLVGRLVADPELRRTGNGKPVTSFRLAVDRPTKEKQTDWLDIVAWEQKAEFAARNFRRGQEVLVDGELQSRSYTDKDGNKRTAVEVKANVLRFVGSRAEQEPEPEAQQGGFTPIDDEDEQLPF
jgi:single-strand DNA-binding protein